MNKENVLPYKPREVVGSKAFNLEYEPQVMEERLRDDIVSYLGEYRFQLQKYNYSLEFSGKTPHEMFLRDAKTGIPMRVTAKRAILERRLRGEPTHREEAEERGIESLDRQLLGAKDGDAIFWGSPPGPKEQGYGDYGFIFVGKVSKKNNTQATISMTAIRVEHPTIEQYNRAMTLLTGTPFEYKIPEQFLKSPKVGKPIESAFIDKVIGVCFNQKIQKEKDPVFDFVVDKMKPVIDEFIQFVKFGTREEKITAFHALENYALDLKKKKSETEQVVYLSDRKTITDLQGLVALYGYRPPSVLGSCGATGDIKSSNIFNTFTTLKNALENNEWFTCPKCNWQADGPIGNGPCGGCGLTLSQWMEEAKKSGEKVCA